MTSFAIDDQAIYGLSRLSKDGGNVEVIARLEGGPSSMRLLVVPPNGYANIEGLSRVALSSPTPTTATQDLGVAGDADGVFVRSITAIRKAEPTSKASKM